MDYWRTSVGSKVFWVIDTGKGPYQVRTDSGEEVTGTVVNTITRLSDPASDLSAHFGVKSLIKRSRYQPGQYHPRIYRPNNYPPTGRLYGSAWSGSVAATRNILARLEEVFRIVEPQSANDGAFGHELRHLLILACTEVESACKSVLKANGYPTPNSNNWKTIDYVKTAPALRLDEWVVSLTRHPDYRSFSPFKGWSASQPTKSLDWYHAYNQTKHDREAHLLDATLRRTILASAAAYVMVRAQFGQFGFDGQRVFELDAFQIENSPEYSSEEYYVPPRILQGTKWTSTPYVF